MPDGKMTRVTARVRRRLAGLPLRWRIALASFGLLAVLLGALGVLISSTVQQSLLSNQADALRSEVCLAITGTALPRGHGPFGPFGPAGMSTGLECRVPASITNNPAQILTPLSGALLHPVLLAPDGSVSISEYPTRESVMLSPSEVTSHLTSNYLIARDASGHREQVLLIPIYDPSGQLINILQVSTPTSSIDGSVAQVRFILFLGIAAALLLAAGLTLPLINTALRPLVTMERTSRHIAAGDLSLRLAVPEADDEIGRLARAFNWMVAQLELTFNRQKQFVADVSHELRTPLTAFSGGLEMLMLGADAGDPEASRRLMRGMYSESERMRHLVEDLLTLTRLDEGRLTLRRQPVEVGPLLHDVAESGQHLTHGQEFRVEVADALPYVLADVDRLKQVLLNLLENAVKYTPAPGTITLRARPDLPHFIAIEVADTGTGIPSEALPHVFERFYRADPSRTRNVASPGGSGLGLAIARSLIEAQGGMIAIASKLGEGTTVTIRLAAAETTALPGNSGTRAKPQPRTVASVGGEDT